MDKAGLSPATLNEMADSICKCTTQGFIEDFLGCPVAKTFSWPVVELLNRFGQCFF